MINRVSKINSHSENAMHVTTRSNMYRVYVFTFRIVAHDIKPEKHKGNSKRQASFLLRDNDSPKFRKTCEASADCFFNLKPFLPPQKIVLHSFHNLFTRPFIT